MRIVSLFSGCGGLDLGFEQAGFDVIWANEFDREIWETYEKNHPNTRLDRRSISDISSIEIPDCDGIIGGPPCQSWSEAGAQRGIADERGLLFLEYIRVLKDKQPKFFLAENVSGMMAAKHRDALNHIVNLFEKAGYNVAVKLVNAKSYGVPQDRRRVIFVGYHREKVGKPFEFPKESNSYKTLRDQIWDLRDSAIPAREKNYSNGPNCLVSNHEYMVGGFSSIYMSRNRVRAWDEPSFTIQAGGRHAPIHPQANKMIRVGKDQFIFDPESPQEYRRLSVRECARIQTFPDEFIFYYDRLASAYKMIGNAVPVDLARTLAMKIRTDMESICREDAAEEDTASLMRQVV